MTKIESIQSRIIGRMQDVLTNEQLQHLENVLAIAYFSQDTITTPFETYVTSILLPIIVVEAQALLAINIVPA